MQYVLGEHAAAYGNAHLHRLVDLFTRNRLLRGEPMLGIHDGARLVAVALVSNPLVTITSDALSSMRAAAWQDLGEPARLRYQAYGDACRVFDVDAPHIHVNMIGVRQALKGKGLGRRLMTEVDRLALSDPDCAGITLTTEVPANVKFYEHLGYENTGQTVIAPGLTSWGFFRRVREVA
jgi:GNAT superfamily N-acetyltransferase